MERLANILAGAGVGLAGYAFVAKLSDREVIEWILARANPRSVLVLAAFVMLTATFVKLSGRVRGTPGAAYLSGKKVFLWISSVVCIGALFGVTWASLMPRQTKPTDEMVIRKFNEIYVGRQLWLGTKWLGIPSQQNPCDQWIMQEMISEIKPDFVVETGTNKGGTSLFYATILERVNPKGKVITVDIDPQVEEAARFKTFRERVEVIKGDSVSPEVIDKIREKVGSGRVLVTLDSLHRKEHVLKELNLYSKFVSLNSYIVVQDTMMDSYGLVPGPMAAVKEFLKTNKNFEVDRGRERLLLTFYPSGYLKKVTESP